MALLAVDDGGWSVERVEIPHEQAETRMSVPDMRTVIEAVVSETKKSRSVEEIARKHRLETAFVEQIVRLYVTHPGVTVEGIMMKMGL
jgi:hypothetical protein